MYAAIAADPASIPTADALIVPGCPAEEDGGLSECQRRRVAWAWQLWSAGRAQFVIPSGGAAHNPYVEADVMGDALVALGVPADRVLRERRALHTDQNIAWALGIAEERGFTSLIVASDPGQARPGCTMVRAWSDLPCTAAPLDPALVGPALALPPVADLVVMAEPVPDWVPLEEQEARIAAATGTRPRPSSFVVYARGMLRGGRGTRPAPPPG